MLSPYNVKIKVYCANDTEAQKVQQAVSSVSSDVNLIGAELLTFYSKFKPNEHIIKPILSDVIKSGVGAVVKHIPKLLKLK